jgi:hypothetical protein
MQYCIYIEIYAVNNEKSPLKQYYPEEKFIRYESFWMQVTALLAAPWCGEQQR